MDPQIAAAETHQRKDDGDQFDHQQQAQKHVTVTKIGQVGRNFGAGDTFFGIIGH